MAQSQDRLTSWRLNPNSWHTSEPQACSVAGSPFTRYQRIDWIQISRRAPSVGGLGVKDHRIPDPRVLALSIERCVDAILRSTSWALGSKHQVAVLQLSPGHTKLFKILKSLPFLFDFLFGHLAHVDETGCFNFMWSYYSWGLGCSRTGRRTMRKGGGRETVPASDNGRGPREH